MRTLLLLLLCATLGGAIFFSTYLGDSEDVHAQGLVGLFQSSSFDGLFDAGDGDSKQKIKIQDRITDAVTYKTQNVQDAVRQTADSVNDKVKNTLSTTTHNIQKHFAASSGSVSFPCKEKYFADTSGHIFASDMEFLAKMCIAQGTIKPHHFYPQNFVRRADVLTMLVRAYADRVPLQEGEISSYTDIQHLSSTLRAIIHDAAAMGLLDYLVGTSQTTVGVNEFVSHTDIRALFTFLHIQDQDIALRGLDILSFDSSIYATRAEFAHVLRQTFPLSIEETSTPTPGSIDERIPASVSSQIKDLGISILQQKNILTLSGTLIQSPSAPVSREEFLTLLVRAWHAYNPSLPTEAPAVDYFVDVDEGTGMSTLTQAKNLGLTHFFEETKRGKTYLKPNDFVTLYEVEKVLNQLGLYQFDLDPTHDALLVQGRKLAQMITLTFQWKKAYHFKDKMNMGDVVNKVSTIFGR